MDVFRGHPSAGVRHVRVMLTGRVHGRMSEHIRHKVNISGFIVQVGSIGAPELVGTDPRFERGSHRGVFFDQVLHSPLGDPAALEAEEQGILVAGNRLNPVPFLHIFGQGFRNLGREVEHHLVSALPGNNESIVFQVHVPDIHTDALILKQAVAEAGMNIEIHASAEYRIDEYWNEQYKAGAILPLPGNYLLLENSFAQELIGIDQLMFDLRVKKYNPILAHPERYGYYYDRKERYKYLHSAGVKFQVNILSLEGFFGGRARSAAMWLIENNLVDMLGSDMHNHEQGEIIKEYLQSKDWRKISERLQGRMINDLVR